MKLKCKIYFNYDAWIILFTGEKFDSTKHSAIVFPIKKTSLCNNRKIIKRMKYED